MVQCHPSQPLTIIVLYTTLYSAIKIKDFIYFFFSCALTFMNLGYFQFKRRVASLRLYGCSCIVVIFPRRFMPHEIIRTEGTFLTTKSSFAGWLTFANRR